MGAPAHAWEPSSGKWTPVVEQTLPEHLVHYATLPADEARQMLSASDAALLYDRAQGFDLVPDRGVTLRSLEGLSLVDIDFSKLSAHPKALAFHRECCG